MHRWTNMLSGVVLALLSAAAPAATFTVTSTADAGTGSLRQALLDARVALSPPHRIEFAASFPINGEIVLASALPSWINGRLTIDGNGRAPRINGNQTFSLFVVGAGGTRLDLEDLVLIGGRRANTGGCVALAVAGDVATLDVLRTRFTDCRALAAGSPRGGAIDWEAGAGSQVLIVDSTFTNNLTTAIPAPPAIAGGAGGAVSVQASTIIIDGSRFDGNLVDVGGATSGGIGGALRAMLLADGIGSIEGSVFRNNSATPLTTDGLGVGGAASLSCSGPCQWSVSRSEFTGNQARRGGAITGPGPGPGATSAQRRIDVVNNSFIANDANDRGGAVHLVAGAPRLIHNAFFFNDAPSGAHLAVFDSTAVRAVGNVLAAVAAGSACASGNVVSDLVTGNLSQATCAIGAGGNIPLQPGMADPIVDAGPPGVLRFDGNALVIDAVTGNAATDCPTVDARGSTRPIDGDGDGQARCDLGAFEHPSVLVFRNGFEP
jgi:hypothetical protein